jgi:hypothetical protein
MNENFFGESLRMVVINSINNVKNHENTTVSLLVKSAVHLSEFLIITRVPREEFRCVSRHVFKIV